MVSTTALASWGPLLVTDDCEAGQVPGCHLVLVGADGDSDVVERLDGAGQPERVVGGIGIAASGSALRDGGDVGQFGTEWKGTGRGRR